MTAAMLYASVTWNCDGGSPPCEGCNTVPAGSGQSPYGCADWVAHVLAAGGFIQLDKCGDINEVRIQVQTTCWICEGLSPWGVVHG